MLLELGISVISASGDWLELVVAYNPDRWVLWIPQGHPQEHPQGPMEQHKAEFQPQTTHIVVFEFGWV